MLCICAVLATSAPREYGENLFQATHYYVVSCAVEGLKDVHWHGRRQATKAGMRLGNHHINDYLSPL